MTILSENHHLSLLHLFQISSVLMYFYRKQKMSTLCSSAKQDMKFEDFLNLD